MSPAQTCLYWREFAAVRAVKPDADRHALHVEALGVSKSSKDFTNADFDRVLGVFRAVSQPASLSSQMRQLGQRRARLLYRLEELTACLGLYVDDPAAYITALLKERFHVVSVDELSDQPTMVQTRSGMVEARSKLLQLVMTLTARVNALRNTSGQTIHAMKTLANVHCDCAECARPLGAARKLSRNRDLVDVGEPF
jgi:hypothetical protein